MVQAPLSTVMHTPSQRRAGGRRVRRRRREVRRAPGMVASLSTEHRTYECVGRPIECLVSTDRWRTPQQHLVALGVNLRMAKQLAGEDPTRCAPLPDDPTHQLHTAIAEVRDLAHGIYPRC